MKADGFFDFPLSPEKLAERAARIIATEGQLILIEEQGIEDADLMSLVQALALAASASDRRLLLVDAQPQPRLSGTLLGDYPEGFTEMVFYGLSPQAVVMQIEALGCDFIPAGAPRSLSIEDPAEPARSLDRIRRIAPLVVVLADGGDEESILGVLRQETDSRFLVGSKTEVNLPDQEDSNEAMARKLRSRHNRRYLIRIVPLVLVAATLIWWSLRPQGPHVSPRDVLPVPDSFQAVSEQAVQPVLAEVDSLGEQESMPATAAESAPTATPPLAESPDSALTDRADLRKSAPPLAIRRLESRKSWKTLLDHKGGFHVHVESYQDSVLAARHALKRGFAAVGYDLQPVRVRGELYFRLCVGPFSDLDRAAAFRDSLLDQADVEYCVLGISK